MQVFFLDFINFDTRCNQVVKKVVIPEVPVAGDVAIFCCYNLDVHSPLNGFSQEILNLFDLVVVWTYNLNLLFCIFDMGFKVLNQLLATF